MELLSGHEKIITKYGNIKSGFCCIWKYCVVFISLPFLIIFKMVNMSLVVPY